MCHNIRAFIEIEGFYANGLVHISQLAKDRVEDVADVVNIGQEVFVKVSGWVDIKAILVLQASTRTNRQSALQSTASTTYTALPCSLSALYSHSQVLTVDPPDNPRGRPKISLSMKYADQVRGCLYLNLIMWLLDGVFCENQTLAEENSTCLLLLSTHWLHLLIVHRWRSRSQRHRLRAGAATPKIVWKLPWVLE